MGVVTFTDEFSSRVPAKKLFIALILDADNLISKLIPQAVESVKTIEGDGGPGTVKILTFGQGGGVQYVKHRVDAIDKEKMTYSYSVIEGDVILEKVESIAHEFKLEEIADGGSKGTIITKFHPKPGFEIKEEDIKERKEKAQAVLKVVEAYLSANPQAYA